MAEIVIVRGDGSMLYAPTKILLVEDDEDDYTLVRELLSGLSISGSSLHWVSDYDAALQALLTDQYDVCLLDYQLGSRDGLEFLREATQSGCRTPVVFLTGQGDYKLDLEAMKSGAADYLSKDQLSAALLERSIRYTLDVKQKNEERKKAEEALRESEERLQLALEGANDGVWDWNIKTGAVLRSPGYFSMLGYEEKDSRELFQEWQDLLHPDDRAAVEAVLQECLTGGRRTYQAEYRMLNKSGEYSWILSRGRVVAYDENGNPLRMAGAHTDITQRKQAEEALSSKEAALRGILDAANESIWLFTPDGFVITTNEMALRRYGKSAEEVIGKHYNEILRTDLAQSRLAHLKRSVEMKRVVEFEDQRVGIYFHHTLYPVMDCKDRVTSVVCFSRDITERKLAEDERLRLEQRLYQAQKAESLGRMAGAIAHNFNNMLGAVIGNLELALEEAPKGSRLQRFISGAMDATLRASRTCRFMLTYLGQTTGKAEPINLVSTMKQACALMSPSLPAAVHLRVEYPPVEPIILADAAQLTQILSNLIANSVEAIGEHKGEIALTMVTVAAGEISSSKLFPVGWQPQAQEYACLSLTDTGSGIDPENQDKIFDPFFSTRFTGRGLGLSVALGLLRTIKGAISVKSYPGMGTTFKLFLPLSGN